MFVACGLFRLCAGVQVVLFLGQLSERIGDFESERTRRF
jgi:hypothetical protein